RGIFLCRRQDLLWFYQEGASRIFPDHWEEFRDHIPLEEQDDLMSAYYRRLTGQDEIARMSAAKIWSTGEGNCSTLRPNSQVGDHFAAPRLGVALARIEARCVFNDASLESDQILAAGERLQSIPGIIVHGRYGVVCPPD